MKSMTGFASLEVKQKDYTLEIRLKSLNSRFLELRVNLPPEMADLEGEIRKRVQGSIRRGNVDLLILRRSTKDKNVQVITQKEVAKAAKQSLSEIAKQIGDTQKITLDHILKVVSPIQVLEDKTISEKQKKEVLVAVEKALKLHEQEKIREGKSIVTELKKLLQGMQKDLEQIQKHREKASKILGDKYQERLKTINQNVVVDKERIQQEIVIQMDRTDIHEEIVRLTEHIRSFAGFLAEDNGKKLDFYTQELLREANTIGSKAQVVEITSAIVNIKCHIERIRELVQNLE